MSSQIVEQPSKVEYDEYENYNACMMNENCQLEFEHPVIFSKLPRFENIELWLKCNMQGQDE